MVQVSNTQRAYGQFFTELNPFDHPAFLQWADQAQLSNMQVLEPFAGANSLVGHLMAMGLCAAFSSFDIEPQSTDVQERDTLASFPTGYHVCITNPPWLAKNLATFRGLPFYAAGYDDVYKFALDRCLEHCQWVAALIPESFIRADLFRSRLTDFVSLPHRLFKETKHPVGLALFAPHGTAAVRLWLGDEYIGRLTEQGRLVCSAELALVPEIARPTACPEGPTVRFNVPDGNVGLIALDNTKEASIRFCEGRELDGYAVKSSGRHITRVSVEGEVNLNRWNEYLLDFRERTRDLLMTCYRGVRQDGMYRRRLDWDMARGIIHNA